EQRFQLFSPIHFCSSSRFSSRQPAGGPSGRGGTGLPLVAAVPPGAPVTVPVPRRRPYVALLRQGLVSSVEEKRLTPGTQPPVVDAFHPHVAAGRSRKAGCSNGAARFRFDRPAAAPVRDKPDFLDGR